MGTKKYILDAAAAEKKLRRMALEIVERNDGETELVLAGIKENGSVIAAIISAYVANDFKGKLSLLELGLDKKKPAAITLTPQMDLNDKVLVLIDDVANSGRTMLYALKPLLEQYPKKIQTLALVERTHKTFPVDVDYIGVSVSTALDEHIYVEVAGGKVSGAWMEEAN